jgi:hypothetical protein
MAPPELTREIVPAFPGQRDPTGHELSMDESELG